MVNKITTPPKAFGDITSKINEIIDNLVDATGFVKKDGGSTQQTITLSSGSGTTALGVKSKASSSYISFNGSSAWLGSYGVSSDKKPVFYNGTGYTLAYTSDIPDISNKQDTLVSGTNIKTINNQSILGSGNISISGGSTSIDELTITQNTNNELQTVGVLNSNGGGALKLWTGTKAEYDALSEGEWSEAAYSENLGSYWRSVSFNGEYYVTLNNFGLINFAYTDLEWEEPETQYNLIQSTSWMALDYDGTKFIALSADGYISTSTIGIAGWSKATQNANLGDNDWVDLTHDSTKFVALSFTGYISTSTDGTTWTTAVQNTNLGNHNWYGLAYDGTKFVALSNTGYISTSTDGTTWTTAIQNANLGNNSWTALTYNGKEFIALGLNGYTSTSTDGTTWTTAVQNTNLGNHSWKALTYDGSRVLAIGDNYTSTLEPSIDESTLYNITDTKEIRLGADVIASYGANTDLSNLSATGEAHFKLLLDILLKIKQIK